MYTCRECERPINQASELCPYCGADLTAPASPEVEVESPAKRRKTLLRRWLLWGVMIAAMWGFLWFVLPERTGDAAAMEAEQRAIEAMRLTAKALEEFKATSRRYPDSLEAMTGSSLAQAREAAQRAQALGYRLEYAPGPPGADGLVNTYSLLARPGNFGFRNFFTNGAGIIRATGENRPATAQDPPI